MLNILNILNILIYIKNVNTLSTIRVNINLFILKMLIHYLLLGLILTLIVDNVLTFLI